MIPIGGLSNRFLDDLIILSNLHDKLILKQADDLKHFEDIHNPNIRKKSAQRPRRMKL